MRVIAAGLDRRLPGQPVVVLESGAPDPVPGFSSLETWKALLPELTRNGPVIAYERRGTGLSEPDSETPTMARVARVLHALLAELRVAPPYVLVGHSWGGNYIRAFTDQFPSEVKGLVFIDAYTGTQATRDERAAVVLPEDRAAALATPVLPSLPANTPPGIKAELEQVGLEIVNDGQEARRFRPLFGIPVAVIVATPPNRMRGSNGAVTRQGIQRDLELVLSLPNSLLVTANHVGHAVHERDPALVARLVEHVLRHPPAAAK